MSTARAIIVTVSANSPAISSRSSGWAAMPASPTPASSRLPTSNAPRVGSDQGRRRASAQRSAITDTDAKCITFLCVIRAGQLPSPPATRSTTLNTAKKPNASRNTVLPSSARRA